MASSSAQPGAGVLRTVAYWSLPWLCSSTAHMLLLVGMALVYQWVRDDVVQPGIPGGTGLTAIFISDRGDADSMGVDAGGVDSASGGSRYYDDDPAPPAQQLADSHAGGGAGGNPALSALLNEKPVVSLAGVLPRAGQGSGTGGVEGEGIGSAQGLTTEPRGSNRVRRGYARTSVFGVGGEGHKFVYVFDRSGSMDGHGGAPLSAAKAELNASLNHLGQTHQFQIIFYNEHPRVFNPTGTPGKLVFGTDQNKYLAQKFVGSITADGATRHEEALAMAVRMVPDVIFFLTDADEPRLTAAQLAHITQMNKGTSINAIEFGYGPQSDADNFLVKLARQNGGKHAYVDISQLPVAPLIPARAKRQIHDALGDDHGGILLAFGALAAPAWAIDYDERYIENLRARGQFDEAEKYCSELLADASLPDARRVDATIELSRTLAEHALRSPPDRQAERWQRAQQVADDFAARNPRHPKLVLVQLQAALAAGAQGEALRDEAELGADNSPAQAAARAALRRAVARFRGVDEQIAAQLQRRNQNARLPEDRAFTADQLTSLQHSVRRQRARALRNQALCYPRASADRTNSLTQAIELLRPLTEQDLDAPSTWSSRLDELACRRLLEDYDGAGKRMAQWERLRPPVEIALKLRAERIRLALARGDVDRALSEASQDSGPQQPGSTQFDFARLEAYLAAWRRVAGHDAAEASEWEQAAIKQVRTIERSHGPASTRRAGALLARALAQTPGAESVESLNRAAASFYQTGQFDQALAAYDAAARRAREQLDSQAAFDSELAAATIEKEREHYRSAIDRYRKLAMAQPDRAKADEAHLLAIHCAAQLAEQQSLPKLDEYERLLREHLATWPKGPTASQSWWWLGRLREHQGAWHEAIKALGSVQPDHEQYAAAVEAAGRCYRALLAESRQDGRPDPQLAKEAVRYFEQVIGPGGKPTGLWSAAPRSATLAAARICLLEMPAGATQAEAMLNVALRGAEGAPADWRDEARALLSAAMAAGGRVAEAEEQLQFVPLIGGDGLRRIGVLGELADRASGQRRKDLATLELQAIDRMHAQGDKLDAPARGNLARLQAAALAASGRRSDAIVLLQPLAEGNPRDGQMQEELARLLADADDAETLKQALAKWREVASKSRPETPRWYRAQLGIARTQLKLGDATQARSTIQLVASSHPEFGGAEMKAKFEQLLAQCGAASAAPKK